MFVLSKYRHAMRLLNHAVRHLAPLAERDISFPPNPDAMAIETIIRAMCRVMADRI